MKVFLEKGDQDYLYDARLIAAHTAYGFNTLTWPKDPMVEEPTESVLKEDHFIEDDFLETSIEIKTRSQLNQSLKKEILLKSISMALIWEMNLRVFCMLKAKIQIYFLRKLS